MITSSLFPFNKARGIHCNVDSLMSIQKPSVHKKLLKLYIKSKIKHNPNMLLTKSKVIYKFLTSFGNKTFLIHLQNEVYVEFFSKLEVQNLN